MISCYRWNTALHVGQWLDLATLQKEAEELRTTTDTVWIDLAEPTPDEEHLVFHELLPLHPLIVEDITKLRRHPEGLPHFPKVEEFPDYLFVVVNPLRQDLLERIGKTPDKMAVTDDRASTQLSAVLSNHLLITHHYEAIKGVEELRCFLSKHQAQAGRGPDFLFHLVLDTTVDQYVPVLDYFDDVLDDFEERVVTKPTPEMSHQLLHLKREIIGLRKTIIYEREVLARLCRGEFNLIDEREMVYYRNVYDHLVRFTELIESSREMVSDLMQTLLSATSNKLNEIMKVLTMISTVVLPMTLVTSIYGMNFTHMPEIGWEFGYPLALTLMVLTGISSFLLFRLKKWI